MNRIIELTTNWETKIAIPVDKITSIEEVVEQDYIDPCFKDCKCFVSLGLGMGRKDGYFFIEEYSVAVAMVEQALINKG